MDSEFTVIPVLEGIRYEASSISQAISGIQAGKGSPDFANSESGLTLHTERLFKLLEYFGNQDRVVDGINGLEEEQCFINLELGYASGNSDALTRMSEEAMKISASPERYVDLKRVNGDLYEIGTGRFFSK